MGETAVALVMMSKSIPLQEVGTPEELLVMVTSTTHPQKVMVEASAMLTWAVVFL